MTGALPINYKDKGGPTSLACPIVGHRRGRPDVHLAENNAQRIMVMGGAKQQAIGRFPLLTSYLQAFEHALTQPFAKLMVIGYGFRDLHVNQVIAKAMMNGLRLSIIDPRGVEVTFNVIKSGATQGETPSSLDALLKRSLAGASRRGLSEIFGIDQAELNKILRFF